MSTTDTIRVLIVDDHPVVREGFAAIIDREPDMMVVELAASGSTALMSYRLYQPDVTLMDLRMPDGNGITAITAIRAEFPQARIIVLTTYDGDDDIYNGLRAGARGYLLKDAPTEDLLVAIRTVHAGELTIPSTVALKLAHRIGGAELTKRERDVLSLLVQGMSNQDIGMALHVSEGTVKFHLNHILSKLGVSDRTQAVISALKRGIVQL